MAINESENWKFLHDVKKVSDNQEISKKRNVQNIGILDKLLDGIDAIESLVFKVSGSERWGRVQTIINELRKELK